ncbi:unnamed protein product [Durusdinium trenchii]|uniref:Uncharacterized protein n=1 Tax=Durusdinium trenchii TaxID=1381693 RepID=A0ABP0KI23_9DINO
MKEKGKEQGRREKQRTRDQRMGGRLCSTMFGAFPDVKGMLGAVPTGLWYLDFRQSLLVRSQLSKWTRWNARRDYRMGMSGMSDKLKQATLSRAMGFLPEIKDRHAGHAHGRSQERVEEDRWFGPESEIQRLGGPSRRRSRFREHGAEVTPLFKAVLPNFGTPDPSPDRPWLEASQGSFASWTPAPCAFATAPWNSDTCRWCGGGPPCWICKDDAHAVAHRYRLC